MLARIPKGDPNVIPVERWRKELRSKLALWEQSQPPKKAKSKPRKLNRDRRRHLVESVARIMREGREQGAPSHFTFEASCRHGLRSGLCLDGWNWTEADAAAHDIVATALNRTGARRPSWKEGQPEYTQDGALPIERERCIRCRKPLPEGHWKFCGDVCRGAHYSARANQQLNAERLASEHAAHATGARK